MAAFIGLLFLAGTALAQDSAADQYLAEMNIIADALEGIHDDESAEEALVLMAAALARLEPIAEQMRAWSDAEKMNFIRTNMEQYQIVQIRISNALMQMVQNPEYMELFIEHMKNMPRID